eukprot:3957284-Pleurochrysis_carterae.AAC.3
MSRLLRVADLEREEKGDHLERVAPAVDVVAEEAVAHVVNVARAAVAESRTHKRRRDGRRGVAVVGIVAVDALCSTLRCKPDGSIGAGCDYVNPGRQSDSKAQVWRER